MLVTFNPRHRPEFKDVWAGTYCTFAKEKSKGDIYVFGLNNYNQLGEFQWLVDFRLWNLFYIQ
jgi:regulator of chromosome condensation